MQPSLALCMIVKNEEQYLPYCLGCIYEYLDELIIVDTGSKDKTIEIAEGFCELVPKSLILHMDWKYDFALARNVSQGGATSSHIIWLDGDEVLNDYGVKKIKNELIHDANNDFWLFPRVNFWKDLKHMFGYPDNQYKMYRNTGLKWREKIHETIYKDSYHEQLKRVDDVPIFHYAYVKDPDVVANKMKNYIKIENPGLSNEQITECSTQHSFFKNELPPNVQPYRQGLVPEIFSRMQVTEKFIKKDNQTILKFKGKRFFNNEMKPVVKEKTADLNSKYSNVLTSIVIATYNKLDYVRQCIFSIYENTSVPFELIVVDNGSTEDIKGFIDILKQTKTNIKYVRLDRNEGFSRGYNVGISEAEGEFILVLNNDTLFSQDFLSKMLDVWHLRQPFGDAGLVGPISNNNPSENGSIVAPEGTQFEGYLNILNDQIRNTDYSQYVESSWLTGLCVLFHRTILDDLRNIQQPKTQGIFFEERLPIYHNDTELNWRVHHRLKKKLWIAREAFLWHYGKITVSSLSQNEYNEMKRNSEEVLKELWPEIAGNIKF